MLCRDYKNFLKLKSKKESMEILRKRNYAAFRKGQSLVETALVLPIIILILTAIIDFGLLFNNYLIINNASREGARSAAVGATNLEVDTMIENMTSTLEQANLNVSYDPIFTPRLRGSQLTVTIEYNYNFITPVISSIIPNPLHLTSKTVMRVE